VSIVLQWFNDALVRSLFVMNIYVYHRGLSCLMKMTFFWMTKHSVLASVLSSVTTRYLYSRQTEKVKKAVSVVPQCVSSEITSKSH